jgi:WD repeat-containing protein 76
VRLLDLNTLQGTVIAATDADDDAMVTGVDSKDGHTIRYADSVGGVGRCDLRAPSPAAGDYVRLHERKISHVDIHPTQHHLFATASVDRTVRLWDARGTLRTPWAELVHGLAVNAACFSPDDGASLLTTSYDDHVRVYRVATAPSPTATLGVAAPHNNQTGRWVTGFRATWLPWAGHNDAVVVGSMQRQMDVLSASTGAPLAHLASPALTTIPAVTVTHPSIPVLAGGVASGRCYVFRHRP